MAKYLYDVGRAQRWRALRRTIRMTTPDERNRLLRGFGNDIRVIAPLAAKESAHDWDVTGIAEFAFGQGTTMGGWWQADPANPEWPGRDRLFLGRPGDLLGICCCLSVLGFFPVEQVAAVVDGALAAGADAVVPGLEAAGCPARDVPALAWESALESARSKRRWRDYLGMEAGKEWANPEWRESPAVWRTFVTLDPLAEETVRFREFPKREGDVPAGLIVLIPVERGAAPNLADEWRLAGWDTAVVARGDCLGLYDALATAADARPTAIMIAIGQTSLSSRTVRRAKEPTLLGELSDEQFHAIVEESIQF